MTQWISHQGVIQCNTHVTASFPLTRRPDFPCENLTSDYKELYCPENIWMHWCFLLAFPFRVKNLSCSHWHRNTADSIRRNTAVSMWATWPQPYDAHSDLTDFSQSPHFSPAPCHGFHSSQWRPLFHHALSTDFYLAHNNVMVLFDNEFKLM